MCSGAFYLFQSVSDQIHTKLIKTMTKGSIYQQPSVLTKIKDYYFDNHNTGTQIA